MSVTSARASLRVRPVEATAQSVTKRLGIAPDLSHEVGELKAGTQRQWAAAIWIIESKLPETASLSAHLSQLLDVMEDKIEVLMEMHSEGYGMDWFCFVDRDNGQGGPSFAPELLNRLGALPITLELDIY